MAQVQRISSNNTAVARENGKVVSVVLHNTQVFTRQGDVITLNSGGYATGTTATRLNQVRNECELPFSVYRREGYIYAQFGPLPERHDSTEYDFTHKPVSYNLATGEVTQG